MFTDGGGDHNITRISTQVSLIRLFTQLNPNMLIALRCCPTKSWVNPAERIMSILNLALQNCSLERTKMSDELEQKMKSVNNMNNLRNLTKHCVNLRESFRESMNSVKEIVNARFETMSLKDERISTQPSYSSENVKSFAESIHLTDKTVHLSQLTKSDLKK